MLRLPSLQMVAAVRTPRQRERRRPGLIPAEPPVGGNKPQGDGSSSTRGGPFAFHDSARCPMTSTYRSFLPGIFLVLSLPGVGRAAPPEESAEAQRIRKAAEPGLDEAC